MGRQFEGECDDTESWLRACAWGWNERQALRGKKGVAFLKELAASLLALPEKRLIYREFAVSAATVAKDAAAFNSDVARAIAEGRTHSYAERRFETAGVCALGCITLKRKMDKGLTREQAEAEIEKEMGHDQDANGAMETAAEKLKIKGVLAYAVMEANDGYEGEHDKMTPEQRYTHVLAWVQKKIKDAAEYEREDQRK